MSEKYIEKELNEAWDPKEIAKEDAEFAWETGHPMDPAEWENDDKKNIMTEYDFTEEQAEAYKNFYWDYYYICMAGDPYNDDDLDENLTETKATGARGRYQVEESDGDIPYTKEEVEAELKRETNNWETKEDTIRYGFQSEKDFAMEILSQHYECEYKGKEGSDYVIHFWKQAIEEHFAVDTHDQVDEEEIKPVVEINPVNESAANLSLSDRLRRRNAGEPVEPIKHAAEPKESPNITSKEPLSKRLKSKLKEEKATKKFEAGSEKTFAEESEEWAQLQKAADKLTDLSVKNYKYFVGNTYLDFGSGWQWTTILAKKPNEIEFQVLSPLSWRNILNAQSEEELDAAIDQLRSDEYFHDKIETPNANSSERDIFNYLDSIED